MSKTLLGLFIGLSFLFNFNAHSARDIQYESALSKFYTASWHGVFRHLYLKPSVTVFVDITKLKLDLDGNSLHLRDSSPNGLVKIERSEDDIEHFQVTSVTIHQSYRHAGGHIPTYGAYDRLSIIVEKSEDNTAYVEIKFKNHRISSSLIFPVGLKKTEYQGVKLGTDTQGMFKKIK